MVRVYAEQTSFGGAQEQKLVTSSIRVVDLDEESMLYAQVLDSQRGTCQDIV
jgi:hypothetical protein